MGGRGGRDAACVCEAAVSCWNNRPAQRRTGDGADPRRGGGGRGGLRDRIIPDGRIWRRSLVELWPAAVSRPEAMRGLVLFL